MSKQDNIVISVKNIHKQFMLPQEEIRSIKSVFTKISRLWSGSYKKQDALNGLSFDVKSGEFFGIVGRNGSGKSTLLKLLGGIYQPTKGSITTKGKVVPFIELGVGFNPDLSGKDNIFLNGAMLGFTDKQVAAKYDSIVAFAELEEFMEQKLKNYSSGMQVRLAFSVATILAESDILLLDEVLAVGDAEFQRKCFDYFKTLKKNKKTVVFVSHDMNAIKDYCDRAILIEDGEVASEGTPTKVATEYTRLFVPENQRSAFGRKSHNRWGTRDLEFTEVEFKPVVVERQEKVLLKCKIKANKDVDEPIVGFSVRNAADQRIMGTNSKISNMKLGDYKTGEAVQLEWELPNIFNDGRYFVSVAAESKDQEAYDWWVDAKSFEVYKNSGTGFLADVTISGKVKKV